MKIAADSNLHCYIKIDVKNAVHALKSNNIE